MKEYIQKFSHAVSGITVYGEEGESAHVIVSVQPDMKCDVKINTEVYRFVEYDLNKVNQVIEDYFMANVRDDEMSNTNFVANRGNDCPACGSPCVVNVKEIEPVGYKVECEECGATWTEIWELKGYDNLI